jgi:PAS domain S-box-containing protein
MLETMVEHGETVIEHELKESQQALFAAIAEVNPVGILVCQGSDRLVTYANSKAMELLGRSILHQSIKNSIIIDNDYHRLEAKQQSAGKVEDYELQMYQADGSPFWASICIHPLSWQGQTALLYTLYDITEKKHITARLQNSEAILREQAQLLEIAVEARTLELQAAEEKYRRIFENAIEGIYQSTSDSPSRYLAVNPALARLYKYDSPEQLMQSITNIEEQVYVDRNRRQEFIRLVTTQEKVTNFESEVYCRDGSTIWISDFDALAEKYHLEKIKTVGDEYMVVGGLPDPNPHHAQAIAHMALDMQQTIRQFQTKFHRPMSLRIGINTGSVVAGVIGQKKFSYDLWGDAVNLASRMESQGEPGKIQVSEMTYVRLRDQFHFTCRGVIPIKGKGQMVTYWLEGRK